MVQNKPTAYAKKSESLKAELESVFGLSLNLLSNFVVQTVAKRPALKEKMAKRQKELDVATKALNDYEVRFFPVILL